MTTIRDPGVPAVEGEARGHELRKLDKATTGRRLVIVLGVSALVLTVANLVASGYLLQTVSNLRALDQRLQDMAGMEKRIKASLEVANTGFQSKLDELGVNLQDQITGLEDGVGQVQRRLDQQASTAAALPEPAPQPTTVHAPPSEAAIDEAEASAAATQGSAAAVAEAPAPADEPVAAIDPPKPRKPSAPPVSKVQSAYQRIESPDGKVYYRRIH
jgi:hypothetical protein